VSARPSIVWSIAGQGSGDAGLQELHAFEAFGVQGRTAAPADLPALAQEPPPAAVKTQLAVSAPDLLALARVLDELRRRQPVPLVVGPVRGGATDAPFADEQWLHVVRHEVLPRTTLLTLNRAEAATLLGVPPLRSDREVELAARALREAGCAAVVIDCDDERGSNSMNFLCAPQAEGWLRLARMALAQHHGAGRVFATSAAAAMALGFVEAEAAVLATMALVDARRQDGPLNPLEGFALRTNNLPGLVTNEAAQAFRFAALQEPHMGLYAVVDSAAWVRRVLAAGVRTVQLRIKDPNHPSLREEVQDAVLASRTAGAQLFVNDHSQLAIEAGAYGVHLGQEDLAAADLDALARAGLRLGVSTHSYWEVARAITLRPSYIACGPIHPTAAKPMPWLPQGNGNLAYWCRVLPLPVVAIAGMDAQRAGEAAACGAAGVAVISAITAAPDPEAAIAQLQAAIAAGTYAQGVAVPALPRPTLR
jgi:hydroxymethylpyrimidine kinase / phosphomethylpyrimidine kinase / thiamine-phosphate diphosphorylase